MPGGVAGVQPTMAAPYAALGKPMSVVLSHDRQTEPNSQPRSGRSAAAIRVMSLPWLLMWALVLSLAWLMPNHFPPWSAFHADAWMGAAVALGAGAVVWRAPGSVAWRGLPLVVAGMVLAPWLQLATGLLPFRGQAWMSSLYLLGFLLVLQVGAVWETASPGQLAKALFLAIGFAAMLSVWLQLFTWLGLWEGAEVTDIWSMGYSGARPYANLGQPNQLATLLIWALLACLWAHVSGLLGRASAVLIAAFLLFGLALTQSRMGWLALTVVVAGVWYWRVLWPDRRLPWAVSGLYLFFWICPFVLRWLQSALMLGNDASFLRMQEQGELRLTAWRLFLQAAWERPWAGYGWTELTQAQIAVADQLPALGVTFGHSHNLFLDLLLWCGIPLGLLLVGVLLRWFWARLRAVQTPQDAAIYMLLGVVAIHAMVELPLHYAYFLLPVGLFMGVLDVRLAAPVVIRTPRWTLTLLCLIAVLALAVTIRDYFRVEASYNALRYEQARINLHKNPKGEPPDVLALTQLREWIRLGRTTIGPGMSERDLEWMASVIRTYPSPSGAFQMAKALALNGHPGQAGLWLVRACKITDTEKCQQVRVAWEQESRNNPLLAAIAWPMK